MPQKLNMTKKFLSNIWKTGDTSTQSAWVFFPSLRWRRHFWDLHLDLHQRKKISKPPKKPGRLRRGSCFLYTTSTFQNCQTDFSCKKSGSFWAFHWGACYFGDGQESEDPNPSLVEIWIPRVVPPLFFWMSQARWPRSCSTFSVKQITCAPVLVVTLYVLVPVLSLSHTGRSSNKTRKGQSWKLDFEQFYRNCSFSLSEILRPYHPYHPSSSWFLVLCSIFFLYIAWQPQTTICEAFKDISRCTWTLTSLVVRVALLIPWHRWWR